MSGHCGSKAAAATSGSGQLSGPSTTDAGSGWPIAVGIGSIDAGGFRRRRDRELLRGRRRWRLEPHRDRARPRPARRSAAIGSGSAACGRLRRDPLSDLGASASAATALGLGGFAARALDLGGFRDLRHWLGLGGFGLSLGLDRLRGHGRDWLGLGGFCVPPPPRSARARRRSARLARSAQPATAPRLGSALRCLGLRSAATRPRPPLVRRDLLVAVEPQLEAMRRLLRGALRPRRPGESSPHGSSAAARFGLARPRRRLAPARRLPRLRVASSAAARRRPRLQPRLAARRFGLGVCLGLGCRRAPRRRPHRPAGLAPRRRRPAAVAPPGLRVASASAAACCDRARPRLGGRFRRRLGIARVGSGLRRPGRCRPRRPRLARRAALRVAARPRRVRAEPAASASRDGRGRHRAAIGARAPARGPAAAGRAVSMRGSGARRLSRRRARQAATLDRVPAVAARVLAAGQAEVERPVERLERVASSAAPSPTAPRRTPRRATSPDRVTKCRIPRPSVPICRQRRVGCRRSRTCSACHTVRRRIRSGSRSSAPRSLGPAASGAGPPRSYRPFEMAPRAPLVPPRGHMGTDGRRAGSNGTLW